ncbi:MAG: MarR family winged helix-turn-helix transcriptional regulator [Lachnotalea sp.]
MELTRVYFIKTYKVISDKGVHPGQASLLRLVSGEGGLSQKEIAQKLNIQPPTVAVSIKRMEKSGWITREIDKNDKRISRIFITESGIQIVKQVKISTDDMDTVVFSGLSDTEKCLLRRILIQLIDNLRATIDEKEFKEVMQHFSEHHDKVHSRCKKEDK